MQRLAISAAVLLSFAGAAAPTEPAGSADVLSDAALTAGDECSLGSADAKCSLNALQRHARGRLQAHKAQPAQEPVKAWGQCGGQSYGQAWTGPSSCAAGYACVKKDEYYSQCLPKLRSSEPELGAAFNPDYIGEDSADDEWEEDDYDDYDDEGEEDEGGSEKKAPAESSEEPSAPPAEPDEEPPAPPAESDEEPPAPPAKSDDEAPPAESDEEPPAPPAEPDEEPPAPPAESDDEDKEGEPASDEPHQVPLTPNPPTPEPPKVAAPLNPIYIKGNFLYDSVVGKRFFAKGVAYNPRNIKYDVRWGKSTNCTPGEPEGGELGYAADVISDELESSWGPALTAMANLGANTVRIYNLDPANSHEKFMTRAAELGLYVIIPLTRKDWGYLPAFPAPGCYTQDIESYGNVGVNLLTTGKLIVKEFSKYNNTLLFTIANEMTVNDKNGFAAFPCVKAYTRDIHRYQASCSENMRRVPLIYADMDIGDDRTMVGEYMSCEVESPDDAVDAYGINVYSWCDESYPDETGKDNFNYSPYLSIKKGFRSFGKPVLFTEFGCNIGAFETHCPYKGGRTWPDVKVIMQTMGEVLSGAVAFEFSMEQNEYGLALTPGFLEGQDKLYLLDNYYALQKQFRASNVSSKWDATDPAAAMADCKWMPDSVAAMSAQHVAPKCPSQDKADDLQRRRGTDKIVSWTKIPPTPRAPLSDVNGQAECPADSVAPDAHSEGCCHMECADAAK